MDKAGKDRPGTYTEAEDCFCVLKCEVKIAGVATSRTYYLAALDGTLSLSIRDAVLFRSEHSALAAQATVEQLIEEAVYESTACCKLVPVDNFCLFR